MRKICDSSKFQNFIMIAVVISSIALAFESPLSDPKGSLNFYLKLLDKVITAIFCFEVVVKVISFGFLCNGADSYIRDNWNMIDFTIVMISILAYFPLSGNL